MKPKAYWNHGRKRGRPKVSISSVAAEIYQMLPKDGSKIGAAELRKNAEQKGMSFTTLYKNLNQLVELGLVYREYDTSKYPPPVYYARTAPYYMGPIWQFPELDKKKMKGLFEVILKEKEAVDQLVLLCDLLKKNYHLIDDQDFKNKARFALATILKGAVEDMAKNYLYMMQMAQKAKDEQHRELFIKMYKELILSAHDSFILRLLPDMPKEVFDELLPPEYLWRSQVISLDPKLFEELMNTMAREYASRKKKEGNRAVQP